MTNQIDGNIKEERSQKLIELSNKNERECNEKYIGKSVEVLFEEEKDGLWSGYTKNYVRVFVESDESLENKILKVEIKDVYELRAYGVGYFSDWGRFFFRKRTVPNQKKLLAKKYKV